MAKQFVASVNTSVAPTRESAGPNEGAREPQAYRAPEVTEVGTLRQMLGTTFGRRRDSRPFCVYTG